MNNEFHATTVVCVRKDGKVALGSDGQVTMGNMVMKESARKVRKLADGRVLAGFAGGVSDALALFEKFEAKRDIGGELLRTSQRLGADMLIMGAYGDSHERETIFGGNTQTIVDTATIPVLLNH